MTPRRLAPGLLAASLLLPVAAAATAPEVAHPRRLLVVSIDGLMPAEYLAPAAHGLAIPNLRRLVAEGAYARAVTGVLPTNTYPSHVTLATGVPPRLHGILGNATFDPEGTANSAWAGHADA